MRIIRPLNEDWIFVKQEDQDPGSIPETGLWVDLPHSWNAVDGHDGSLYVNGELQDVKAADKVFVFTVALKEGMNTICAEAGDIKDTAVLEKVEKEPEIYVLPPEKRRRG